MQSVIMSSTTQDKTRDYAIYSSYSVDFYLKLWLDESYEARNPPILSAPGFERAGSIPRVWLLLNTPSLPRVKSSDFRMP